MSAKLTKAAWILLRRLERRDEACLPRAGSSAMALRLAGYAEWNDQAGARLWWLTITPAGRQALEDGR